MKKMFMSLMLCMMFVIAGCSSQEQADGICPYMIKIEDKSYYCYDEVIEVENIEVLGYNFFCKHKKFTGRK